MAASDNEHCIGDCFSSATVHLAPSDSDRIVRSTASGKRAHQLIVIYTGIANHYYTVELKRRYSHVSRHALVHWTYCNKDDYIAANGRSYGSGEFGPSHLIDVTPATDSLDDAALPEGETYVEKALRFAVLLLLLRRPAPPRYHDYAHTNSLTPRLPQVRH